MVLFQGKVWKRLAVCIYFITVMGFCEVLTQALWVALHGASEIPYMNKTIPYALFGLVALTIFILAGSASVIIWRAVTIRKLQPFHLLFFILPIGQYFVLMHLFYSIGWIFVFLGLLLSLVADIVLLVYTISLEKKTALEDELRETRHIMELEQAHYREVEYHREELAKIRHDFNNQLAAIDHLIHSDEVASVHGIIQTLTREIDQTKENPYCCIPVINAVLAEKQIDIISANVQLDIKLDIPYALSVEPSHLCSIFSNLLDNAIYACRQPPGTGRHVIRLTSMMEGDYLFIKTVNPVALPAKQAAKGRGYGARILADLAARYGGDYQAQYQNGEYCAVVSLLAVNEA